MMCIVAQDGSTFAKLRFNVGPGGEVKIPVCVDYGCEFDAANFELWKQQYQANVSQEEIFKPADNKEQAVSQKQSCSELFARKSSGEVSFLSSDDLIAEIDKMDPIEREIFMEELSVRSDFWNEEGEVLYG